MKQKKLYILWIAALVLITAAMVAGLAYARPNPTPQAQASPLHPVFALLDEAGENVLDSGKPVSSMQTCGQCHDTEFIASHSFHADAGLSNLSQDPRNTWELGDGIFGGWDPLTYRYLTAAGDLQPDLTTPEWLMTQGARHVGGGPAITARDGTPLIDLPADSANPETSYTDPATGQVLAWDWNDSGVVEMNCFLCHTIQADNTARIAALQSGKFGWANTATLSGTGLVQAVADGSFTYNRDAFDADKLLKPEKVFVQDPDNANCGQCHGLVHDTLKEPLTLQALDLDRTDLRRTAVTGLVISGQVMKESGLNLADKESLARSWDVHTERGVKCTDCHYSLNNPVYYQPSADDIPEHLTFDPRRLELGEYLQRPIHDFARGPQASTGIGELELVTDSSMRRCESCHSIENTHDWLPYKERHTNALACESCHVAQVNTPALQELDWTVLSSTGEPRTVLRGIEPGQNLVKSLITGYTPALLARPEPDGDTRLAPYNLVSTWTWVSGEDARPVRLADLKTAYFDAAGKYKPEILQAFDANEDGSLDEIELRIDSDVKRVAVAGQLTQLGLENPRIAGQVEAYSLNHGVATGDYAVKDCQACHSRDSHVTQPFLLSSDGPGGANPVLSPDASRLAAGAIAAGENGGWFYNPDPKQAGLYILGRNSVGWIDAFGAFFFVAVVLGVAGHGALRFLANRRRGSHHAKTESVYMYAFYERLWHWLQTITILGLLFTGLIIHKPHIFGLFSFRGVVLVHNILAGILLANAVLSLFYHLASGEIKQYIPKPSGFIDQAVTQGLYYVRGIFKGDPHPFEKTPQKKLNPLQQATYFGLLNVLLPAQIITGALMWGRQQWPAAAEAVGGLPFLAPLHTLISWLFAAFIVGHIYLTTTGHTPLAAMQAMIGGWEEVETGSEVIAATEPHENVPQAPTHSNSLQEVTEA